MSMFFIIVALFAGCGLDLETPCERWKESYSECFPSEDPPPCKGYDAEVLNCAADRMEDGCDILGVYACGWEMEWTDTGD